MPEAKLAALWSDLEKEGGKFLGQDAPRVQRRAESFLVSVPCRWERRGSTFGSCSTWRGKSATWGR